MKKEKYVPFEWEDRNLLKGRWIKPNYDNDKEYMIIGFELYDPYFNTYYDDYYDLIPCAIVGDDKISFRALLGDYAFDDGTPCGKIENYMRDN